MLTLLLEKEEGDFSDREWDDDQIRGDQARSKQLFLRL